MNFIGIEVTKFFLWLLFIHVAEEFSFSFLHFSKLVTLCVRTVLHFALKVFTLRVHVTFFFRFYKLRVNWRHNLRLFAPSRLTNCLTMGKSKKGGVGTKISSHRVGTQLCKLKTFYKQAMLSDNWAKETILNFILFINISFVHSCDSVSREEMLCIFFKDKVFNCFCFRQTEIICSW